VILIDPPFFQISSQQLCHAVEVLTQGTYKVKLLICQLTRHEREIYSAFRKFGMCRTKFPLRWQNRKEHRCANSTLFSNWDFPRIKRIKNKFEKSGKNQGKKSKQGGKAKNRYIPG